MRAGESQEAQAEGLVSPELVSELIVYGVVCMWWDSIDKAASLPSGLPCCPHCKGVLFEMPRRRWFKSIDEHEANGNPGYRAMWDWARGKHFRTYQEMVEAYAMRAKP